MPKQLNKGEQERCVLRETLKVELPPEVQTGQASGCNTPPALTSSPVQRQTRLLTKISPGQSRFDVEIGG
jgi:hypothetical protein